MGSGYVATLPLGLQATESGMGLGMLLPYPWACKLRRTLGTTSVFVVCKLYINFHGLLVYILSAVSCSSGVPISMISPLCRWNFSLARASMFTINSSSAGKTFLSFYTTTPPAYRNSLPQKFRGWTLSFNIFPSMTV